jgi:hypothetical protein
MNWLAGISRNFAMLRDDRWTTWVDGDGAAMVDR